MFEALFAVPLLELFWESARTSWYLCTAKPFKMWFTAFAVVIVWNKCLMNDTHRLCRAAGNVLLMPSAGDHWDRRRKNHQDWELQPLPLNLQKQTHTHHFISCIAQQHCLCYWASDLFVSIRKYQCTLCTHIPKVTNVIQTSETQYLDSLTRVAVSHLGCVCDGMRQQMTAGEQENRAGQNQVTHHGCWRFKVQAWGLLNTVNGWSLILYTPLCQS